MNTNLSKITLFACFMALSSSLFSQSAHLIIGTYTNKGSKGIYVYKFDTATGKATELSHTDSAINPSFLTISKDKQFVYAVNETNDGQVSTYAIKEDKLKLLQQKSTKGANPCHVTLSADQRNLFVANYSEGSLTSFHRSADGLISNARQIIKHSGSSLNSMRQEKAHVHGNFLSPDGNYLLTTDLGMDETTIYPYNQASTPILDESKAKVIKSSPGSGPRHLAFSNNGRFLYILEELTGSISVYNFNKGQASFLQKVLMHPADFKDNFGSADIHMSPDGLFLYASNRGSENNIVKFPVLTNGKLADKQTKYYSTNGIGPRNFTISADGNWLLVANQNSDNIAIFRRNKITGDLIATGNSIKVSMPVCLVLF